MKDVGSEELVSLTSGLPFASLLLTGSDDDPSVLHGTTLRHDWAFIIHSVILFSNVAHCCGVCMCRATQKAKCLKLSNGYLFTKNAFRPKICRLRLRNITASSKRRQN